MKHINLYKTLEKQITRLEQQQVTGQYTGKIGNALKKAGVVLGNAYEWMDENVRVKTGRLGTVQKVIDGIQNAEDVALG